MKIALVTGASSGLGRAFARLLAQEEGLDELWLVARREDRLQTLAGELPKQARVIPLDLTKKGSLLTLEELLEEERPEVEVLVNAAGFGKFGTWADMTLRETEDMIDLNCRAAVTLTAMTLPYMPRGGRVLEICSSAAFQPLPGFNVYAATKAFLMRYTRALRWELSGRGIRVTAVCPGWIKTEFMVVAQQTKNGKTVTRYPFAAKPERVARQALRDCERGLAVSTCGVVPTVQRAAAKVLPSWALMGCWELLRR